MRKKKTSFKDLFKKKDKHKKIEKKKISTREKEEGFNLFEVIVIIFISVLFGVIVGCIIHHLRLV